MSVESVDHSLHLIRTFNREKVPYPNIETELLKKFLEDSAELAVEIGCGVGLHPVEWALRNPDRRILAIEKTSEKFKKFKKRYEENQSPLNLFPLQAHAVSIITHFVKDKSVQDYFILFPNPEPKSPQSRWVRMPFFSELIRTLKPQGRIHFATNEAFYQEEIEAYAIKAWKLNLESKIESNQFMTSVPRTHFEKKYLERGQTIYSTIWSLPSPS